jgi:hypothetical protein
MCAMSDWSGAACAGGKADCSDRCSKNQEEDFSAESSGVW